MDGMADQVWYKITERIEFFKKFVEAPSQIGSITPSSRFLARKMLEGIDWGKTGALAELGAGTGVFTRDIHKLKHPDCKVVVFEKDGLMRKEMSARYKDLFYFDDVLYLNQQIHSIGIDTLDVVVSGIPFALLDESKREDIIDQVVKLLKPGGTMIAFQYSLQMKSLLQRKFSRVEISLVPLNIPPAFVYQCHK